MMLRTSLSRALALFIAIWGLLLTGLAQANNLPIPACEAFARGLSLAEDSIAEAPLGWKRELLRLSEAFTAGVKKDAASALRRAQDMVRGDHRENRTPALSENTLADLDLASRPELFRAILEQDAYLLWLMDNQARVEPEGTRFVPRWIEPGASALRSVPWEPIELIVAHISTASIHYLPPELALMRVRRDFDPSIEEDTRNTIDFVLERERLAQAATRIFGRVLEINNPLVWAAAPTLERAVQNLHHLEDLIVSHFGKLFPHPVWLELICGFNNDDPLLLGAVQAVHSFRQSDTRINQNQALRQLVQVALYFQLPLSFDLAVLDAALNIPPQEGETYAAFLLRMFPAPIAAGFANRQIRTLYQDLRWLVELGESIQSNQFQNRAARQAEELNFSY